LQEDRINQNQGAEATLSFLLARAEMELLGSAQAAFRQIREAGNGADTPGPSKEGVVLDGR